LRDVTPQLQDAAPQLRDGILHLQDAVRHLPDAALHLPDAFPGSAGVSPAFPEEWAERRPLSPSPCQEGRAFGPMSFGCRRDASGPREKTRRTGNSDVTER